MPSRPSPFAGAFEVSDEQTAMQIGVDIAVAISELPDRTSPDDWPEAMLVTASELSAIVEPIIATALADARERALGEAVAVCRDQQQVFLSPRYATDQPMSSVGERFACARCIEAIEVLKGPA
jgi:hypothetical protein